MQTVPMASDEKWAYSMKECLSWFYEKNRDEPSSKTFVNPSNLSGAGIFVYMVLAPFEHRTRKSSTFFNTYTPIIATHHPGFWIRGKPRNLVVSGLSVVVAGGRLELARGWPRPRALRRLRWSLARCGHHSPGLANGTESPKAIAARRARAQEVPESAWPLPLVVGSPYQHSTKIQTDRWGRLELRAWLATPTGAAQAPLGPCSLWATWPPLLLGSSSLWLGWAYRHTGAARLR